MSIASGWGQRVCPLSEPPVTFGFLSSRLTRVTSLPLRSYSLMVWTWHTRDTLLSAHSLPQVSASPFCYFSPTELDRTQRLPPTAFLSHDLGIYMTRLSFRLYSKPSLIMCDKRYPARTISYTPSLVHTRRNQVPAVGAPRMRAERFAYLIASLPATLQSSGHR
jgi:hypothetical protein